MDDEHAPSVKLPLSPGALNGTEPPDADLVRRFRAGEWGAFTTIVQRWEGSAYGIACRITGDHASAEDVLQAVFLRLLERPSALRRAASLGAWLRRSVINEAINHVRRRRRRGELARRLAMTIEVAELEGSSAQRLEETEEALRLRDALTRLTPEARALLALRFDEDLTYQQIAQVVRCPVSTAKYRVDRAVAALRRHLGEERT